jgi:hypothetical protein
MDQLSPIFDAFDMLDAMLALFGALFVALWFGAGKSPAAILSGAVMGGLVKPLLIGMLLAGTLLASAPQPDLQQSSRPHGKVLDFWTK